MYIENMTEKMTRSKSRNNHFAGEILERAATLFAERGFSETSLQEVADAMGISRPALYHYVSSKEDLLSQLVSGITRARADALAELRADTKLKPLDKVEEAVKLLAIHVARNPARFRLLIVSEASLPKQVYDEHKVAKYEMLNHLSAIISEGIDAGVLKTVDERVAAVTVLGMCNWIAWWYHPKYREFLGDESLGLDRVVSFVSVIALDGLKQSNERSPDTNNGDNIGHGLDLLRQDLTYLERLLR